MMKQVGTHLVLEIEKFSGHRSPPTTHAKLADKTPPLDQRKKVVVELKREPGEMFGICMEGNENGKIQVRW